MKGILCLTLLAATLVTCAAAAADDPAAVVERYLQAKVEGDAEIIRALLCSEMEADLEREAHSFDSVTGVQIEGMTCRPFEQSGRVTCQGKIVALYGTEQNEFQLTTYRVVEEDGAWKWCGEAP